MRAVLLIRLFRLDVVRAGVERFCRRLDRFGIGSVVLVRVLVGHIRRVGDVPAGDVVILVDVLVILCVFELGIVVFEAFVVGVLIECLGEFLPFHGRIHDARLCEGSVCGHAAVVAVRRACPVFGGPDEIGLVGVIEKLEVSVFESLGIRLLGRALFGRFVVRSVVVRTGGKSERTEREDHGDRECQSQDSQFS